jgi:hypothetical protein
MPTCKLYKDKRRHPSDNTAETCHTDTSNDMTVMSNVTITHVLQTVALLTAPTAAAQH